MPRANQPKAFVSHQIDSLRAEGVDVETLFIDRTSRGMFYYAMTPWLMREKLRSAKPDIVHIMYGGVMALMAMIACRDYPIVVSFAGTDLLGLQFGDVKPSLSYKLRAVLTVWTSRRVARSAHGIVAKSKPLAEHLPRRINPNRVWVIPNGVDMKLFRPLDKQECRTRLEWEQADLNVLFGSSDIADYNKRFGLAQSAVKALKEKTGLNVALRVMPRVSHIEVPTWICAADVTLLTSVYEGSPNIIKETLACNRPVVSTDAGDVRERIADIEGCYITDGEKHALADALHKVYLRGGTVDSRSKIAELSLDRVAQRLVGVYKTVAR
jgi:glycosyltransferase involved in cell wall biosynthesis